MIKCHSLLWSARPRIAPPQRAHGKDLTCALADAELVCGLDHDRGDEPVPLTRDTGSATLTNSLDAAHLEELMNLDCAARLCVRVAVQEFLEPLE
jgi:hypothetical protein